MLIIILSPHMFQTLHKFMLMTVGPKSRVLGRQWVEIVHVD